MDLIEPPELLNESAAAVQPPGTLFEIPDEQWIIRKELKPIQMGHQYEIAFNFIINSCIIRSNPFCFSKSSYCSGGGTATISVSFTDCSPSCNIAGLQGTILSSALIPSVNSWY